MPTNKTEREHRPGLTCTAAMAIVDGLHGALHMEPETAAGLAHFYAATAGCSAALSKSVERRGDVWNLPVEEHLCRVETGVGADTTLCTERGEGVE